MARLGRGERLTLLGMVVSTVLAGILSAMRAPAVLAFVVSGLALAVLAAVVGQSAEQVGKRLGPGATGVLQSALGNLPELFVGVFSLRAGLVTVVQTALLGSILANSLLVLGLAFVVGGLRHGTQRFSAEQPRMVATLTVLAVAALTVPTLAHVLQTPADARIGALSVACAVVLLLVFVASVPSALAGDPAGVTTPEEGAADLWPMWLAVALLAVAGVASAFVSNWFVDALGPAIAQLHVSQAFTGLVIVAIAGNAVENVVGIRFAARNQPDYALSTILNSSLQVALGLIPVLVLLSFVAGGTVLTLVFPPLLLALLALATIMGAIIVVDGESTWLEGIALIGFYGIIAAAVWWG